MIGGLCYNQRCNNGDDDGRCTMAEHRDWLCPRFVSSALDAGIPLSVVMGKTKLTDHFSREYIDAQCGPLGHGLSERATDDGF